MAEAEAAAAGSGEQPAAEAAGEQPAAGDQQQGTPDPVAQEQPAAPAQDDGSSGIQPDNMYHE